MMTTRDSVTNIWGDRTPYRDDWPTRVDQNLQAMPDQWVQSACVLCSNGCALDIGVKDGKIVGVRGRESDRVNHGGLGPKGLHAWVANKATAAACQFNNLHLIQGLLGRNGCGIYQMNGQPTGANGDLPGFRNWANPDHVAELARLWNVDIKTIPHWAPPTHAMQIFRYCEQGSIKLLWISGTNPTISLPDIQRTRRILGMKDLFVIVQDAFMTETASEADVVLPVALWGEKIGCFTNADRTVHFSRQAVQPLGEARADLDIFLDYARRMNFRDKDGDLLIHWRNAEEAFEADVSPITFTHARRRVVPRHCKDTLPKRSSRSPRPMR
jgi:anaerobic selenocysteine-containing dehydrogenase